MSSIGKWKAGEVAQRISNNAIEMQGGICVTDELDIERYMKRIRVALTSLGDRDFLVNHLTGQRISLRKQAEPSRRCIASSSRFFSQSNVGAVHTYWRLCQ